MQPIRFAADTIIRSGHMRMFTPSSAVTGGDAYKADSEFFLKNKDRSMFIREAGSNEFENGFDAALKMNLTRVYLEMPKLWVLVFGDETLFFSVPIYRGNQFFSVNNHRGLMVAQTCGDRATRILLAEMESRGGIDTQAFEQWKTKWFAAIEQHNQKALKAAEIIH